MKLSKFVATIVIALASCGSENTVNLKLSSRDTTYTTVDVAVNITSNEYARLTAMKVVFDTTKIVVVDSTLQNVTREIKTIRDSVYMVWYPVTVQDSAGNRLRNLSNTADSFQFRFIPAEKGIILQDFNRKWPIKN